MKRIAGAIFALALAVCVLTACAAERGGDGAEEPGRETETGQSAEERRNEPEAKLTEDAKTPDAQQDMPSDAQPDADSEENGGGDAAAENPTEADGTAEENPAPRGANGICVAIDPGHQRKGNSEKEPVGPGASQTKDKVSSGTTGRWTGLTEYELNLNVGLMLRDELEQRGYRVVMTRTEHDVNISNVERAQLAADAGADIFVRIHANGSDDSSVSGALTACMTPNNPYCAQLYRESRRLSDEVLDAMTEAAGAKKLSVWETDDMSGINWAKMPVTIVEMGFMTNEREDRLLASADYQKKLAVGIANGIDSYFEASGSKPAAQMQDDEPAPRSGDGIQAALDAFVQGKGESWDLCVVDLSAGETFSARANPPEEHGFVSASIIKIFIAGAVYDAVEAGTLNHADVLGDMKLMLQKSDNDATNRLTALLGGGDAEAGMQCVTRFAEQIGCRGTAHNRLMMNFNGKENYTTAED